MAKSCCRGAELAVLSATGGNIRLDVKEDATVLVLNGEPIREPVGALWAICDKYQRRADSGYAGLPSRP
jgi:redox-sensitive bicupin YhaK (pirin superfamily)